MHEATGRATPQNRGPLRLCQQGISDQAACKPGLVPRIRSGATVIHLRSCLRTTWCDLPGQHAEAHVQPEDCGLSLFGLAPGGACLAPFLAVGAVRSYRTVSPLPGPKARRSVLCCAFPGVTPAGRYPAPCLRGARTFLDNTVSGPVAATAQPPDRDLDRPDGAERQASRTGQRLATAATAAIRPRVSSSRTPSQQAGRQRRWNASTTASMPASNE